MDGYKGYEIDYKKNIKTLDDYILENLNRESNIDEEVNEEVNEKVNVKERKINMDEIFESEDEYNLDDILIE